MAELPQLPSGDFTYDPSIVSAMTGTASAASAESLAAGQRASAEAGVVATGRVADNALLSAAIAGTAQASLQAAATESLHAQMTALNPEWRSLVSATAASTQASVDNIAMYMASYAPMMLEAGANLAQTQGQIAQSLMNGQIPDDVATLIRTNAAETGMAHGLFGTAAGGAGRALEARDFGLVALQLQQVGANMAQNNAQLWSNPVLQLANMGASAQTLTQNHANLLRSIIPEVDITPIYGNASQQLNAANVVSAQSVFEGSLQQYNQAMGWGLSMYQTEREAQASYDSMRLQFEADVYGYNAQLQAANTAANATIGAAQLNADAITHAADANMAATLGAAQYQAQGVLGAAQMNMLGTLGAADAAAAATLGAAEFNMQAQIEAARETAAGVITAAQAGADATVAAANAAASATISAANTNAAASTFASNQWANTTLAAAEMARDTAISVANTQANAMITAANTAASAATSTAAPATEVTPVNRNAGLPRNTNRGDANPWNAPVIQIGGPLW